ncbi:hypothetical protein ALI144C_29480 [Actinosynnema sp. ALI-1.44]|uniref:hypothetical protein n=1 Tax=Actinosynnema sp. ALI-1.44 TaxID=1933779 RepID=UPI00097BD604|nr:hypothetical protein [Actinosynnema sp. ALI-1.44]ONI78895.1 hypothetical protein ALI144C_29480 [Actinosynnema sp. ALI-1.44]
MYGEAERRVVEMWFRRRGLPMVVRRQVRGTSLLSRATPALVFLVLFRPLLSWVNKELDKLNVSTAEAPYVIGLLALSLGTFVVPFLVAWFVSRSLRARSELKRLLIAAAVLVLGVVALPIVQKKIGQISNVPITMGTYAVIAVVVLFLVFVGAGSVLAWTLRVAVRHVRDVGNLASRALPLLMIFILFGFFATETWQIAQKLQGADGRRTNLWLVIGLFALLASLFLIAILRDEGREVLLKHRAASMKDYEAVLDKTPLNHDVPDIHNHPLTRREKLNLAVVVFLALALQAVVFAFVVFWFLVVFGLMAIDDSVINGWLGHGPSESGHLFGVPLRGVSDELILVSMFLAGFSGMYFAASNATDPTYRKSFFDPLMADLAVSLAARDAYLTLWDKDGGPPGYPEEGPLATKGDLEWQRTQ